MAYKADSECGTWLRREQRITASAAIILAAEPPSERAWIYIYTVLCPFVVTMNHASAVHAS